MPFYRLGGMVVHIRGGKRLPFACSVLITRDGSTQRCGAIGNFQCDGRTPERPDRPICNQSICGDHAHQAGPDIHYCPAHRQQHLDDQAQGGLFTSLVQS